MLGLGGLALLLVLAYVVLLISGKWAADRFVRDLSSADSVRVSGVFLDRQTMRRQEVDVELRDRAEVVLVADVFGTSGSRVNWEASVFRPAIGTWVHGSVAMKRGGIERSIEFVGAWVLPNSYSVVEFAEFEPQAMYDLLKQLGKFDVGLTP